MIVGTAVVGAGDGEFVLVGVGDGTVGVGGMGVFVGGPANRVPRACTVIAAAVSEAHICRSADDKPDEHPTRVIIPVRIMETATMNIFCFGLIIKSKYGTFHQL